MEASLRRGTILYHTRCRFCRHSAVQARISSWNSSVASPKPKQCGSSLRFGTSPKRAATGRSFRMFGCRRRESYEASPSTERNEILTFQRIKSCSTPGTAKIATSLRTRAAAPAPIIGRRRVHKPPAVNPRLFSVLSECSADLDRGAIVLLEKSEYRVRRLSIQ
jgi:hypothetical protein